jgi:DNA-binding GntR family transcriptional regulator
VAVAFKTKNVAVYEVLRQDIVEGKLKSGQKIIMSDVAKRFGLSDIPVREAIRRLESDGFVQFTPHIGAVVSKMDEKEVIEIYLIRIELEALATRLAVPYVTSDDIDYLEKKNHDMELATKRNRPEQLGTLNKDFNLRIYRAAPYPYLNKLISDLWEKVERTQSVFAYVPERAAASVGEHSQIIKALRSKDLVAAEKLIKEQKNRTMAALQQYIKDSE